MTYPLTIERTENKKSKPPENQLGFGKHFTDHMFIMDYNVDSGWHQPRIIPYQPIVLDPAAKVFHYGQTIFEGLKAYRTEDGRVLLFRPDQNFKRMNRSNLRLSIPQIDEQFALDALRQLIQLDQDWIPASAGTSLYIRPFVISTEAYLGVAPSTTYQFIIIMSPVGPYYAEGVNPVRFSSNPIMFARLTGGWRSEDSR